MPQEMKKIPTIIAVVLLANLILIPIWIWWARDIGRIIHLTCTKLESELVNCDLRQTWMSWTPLTAEVERLNSLQTAELREECEEECSYRLVLRAKNDRASVKAIEEDEERVRQLQAFIDGTADVKTFEARFGGSWWDFAG
jgi:hypothetical protein